MSKINLENLTTERRNQETFGLDEMSISRRSTNEQRRSESGRCG